MDIEKIINDSGNEWENDIANGKFDYFKKYPKLSESSVASSISMQYSEILLKTITNNCVRNCLSTVLIYNSPCFNHFF